MSRADTLADLEARVSDNPVMLFMKGSAEDPRCGFSTAALDLLRRVGQPFGTWDVLDDPEYRYVLCEHTGCPSVPQVFVGGRFVGDGDRLHELFASGELQRLVEAASAKGPAAE